MSKPYGRAVEWLQKHTVMSTISTAREYGAWPVLLESGGQVVLLSFSNALTTVSRWDPQSGRELWGVDFYAGGGPCAVVHTDEVGPILAVASERGVERVNAVTGTVLPSPRMHVGTVWDVAAGVLADGRTVITGAGHHGEVHRWDAVTGEVLGVPLTGHRASVMSIAMVPGTQGEGPLIASGDESGALILWDAATGTRRGEPITGPDDAIVQIVPFDLPAGPTLLACVDRDRRLWRWDAHPFEQVGEPVPVGTQSEIPRVAVAVANGAAHMLVSGTDDKMVREWDPVTGRPMHASVPGISCDLLTRSTGHTVIATGSPEGDLVLYT